MNKIFTLFLAICFGASAYAQNNVGIGTTTPNVGAILDLTSSTQGFLAPRTRIASVSAPVTGLVIFDTDTNCYVLYTGATWRNLCNAQLPSLPQGLSFNDNIYINPNGTVSIVDSNGNHILTSPQSAWTTIGNSGTTAGTNFAGTTDAQDFVLKSNSNEVMRITQQGAVGINTPAPNSTSILDITSTTKGVLFPALTSVQRDAITGPAVGLTIYNTDLNVHQFWNGTCWVNVGQTVCSFTYSLSYLTASHDADCLLVSNFNSVSDTLQVSLVSGTASPVILSAVGVPAGVLVNFSNNYLLPTQTSVMTFTALPSAASGTYTITVLATSGSTVQTLTYTLTVYGYNLTITPPSATVSQSSLSSGSTISTATVTIGNPGTCSSSGSTAILTAVNVPAGVTVNFTNPNLAVPGSTTMTLTSSCPNAGTYTITVEATIGSTASSATYVLTITPPAPINITTNQTNLNLYTLAGSPTCPVNLVFNIAANVTIGSVNTTLPSLNTGAFANGSTITINNAGFIIGAGGAGGDDNGHNLTSCPNTNGQPGGNAISLGSSGVTINNTGTIGGGGGGGGAGEELSAASLGTTFETGGSGGGGAGSAVGLGSTYSGCNAGSNGAATTGGAGGGSCAGGNFAFTDYSGSGGNGGNLGQPGANGNNISGTGATNTDVCGAGTGGAAGCAIKENGFAATVTGTAVLGPVCP